MKEVFWGLYEEICQCLKDLCNQSSEPTFFKWLMHHITIIVFSCSVASNSETPTDCSSPGSSVHEIFQARILEWVAISFSRGSSWPRDWNHVFLCLLCCRRILYLLTRGEAHHNHNLNHKCEMQVNAQQYVSVRRMLITASETP